VISYRPLIHCITGSVRISSHLISVASRLRWNEVSWNEMRIWTLLCRSVRVRSCNINSVTMAVWLSYRRTEPSQRSVVNCWCRSAINRHLIDLPSSFSRPRTYLGWTSLDSQVYMHHHHLSTWYLEQDWKISFHFNSIHPRVSPKGRILGAVSR